MYIFTSLEFIFRFLPIFLICYYVSPDRYRNFLLFGGSLLFYASGAGWYTLLLLGLTVLNWLLGQKIWVHPDKSPKKRNRKALVFITGIDIAVLILFKVLALAVKNSILPLGISFYTFKMISYQADLYTGKMNRQPAFMETAAYFTMFPQVTEGPIMRFHQGYSHHRQVNIQKIGDGVFFFVMGMGMKVLLADRIGILWKELIKIGYQSISSPLAWTGAFAYTFQLYFDFWGYSLMAAGVGLMLGFPFVINFKHPYAAAGIADFYRRWHATLGSWFRDYIYIPLGGSRKGNVRTVLNLMIVWLLTGFWHGGTWNYIIWGAVLGILIIWEKFVVKNLMKKHPVIGHLHVWILVPLTWVIFAIPDLKQLGIYFTRLFPFFQSGIAVDHLDFIRYMKTYWHLFIAGFILCIPGVYRFLVKNRWKWPVVIGMAAVFWISVYFIVNTTGNKFMYFNF